jgi:hypothetical protein
MDHTKIVIPFEEELRQDLYATLNGEIVSEIIKESKAENIENQSKNFLEGYAFRISQDIASHLYELFNEVKSALQFDEPVDFFVTNSSELNAYTINKQEDDDAHIININSGLIEKFNDSELKFVIGHELGHLINRNNELKKIIHFIFNEEKRMPLILTQKVKLWEKLSELTADRFGYLASQDINTAVSVLFKLNSGIDPSRIDFDLNAYLYENNRKLEYLRNNSSLQKISHPFDPVRIKAMDLFSNSTFLKNYQQKNFEEKNDKDLEDKIFNLIEILMTTSTSELDHYRKYFIATGGLIVSNIDKHIAKEEYANILEVLSNYSVFPGIFLDKIVKSENIEEIFYDSIAQLLEINPAERYIMFSFLSELVLIDNRLDTAEIDFLIDVGQKAFGFTKKETSQRIGDMLSYKFYPNVYNV